MIIIKQPKIYKTYIFKLYNSVFLINTTDKIVKWMDGWPAMETGAGRAVMKTSANVATTLHHLRLVKSLN